LSRLADDALRAANNFLDFIEDENSDATPPSALAGDQEELDDLARTVNSHLAQLLAAKNGILDAERGIADAERDIAEARENASEVYIPDEFEIANLQLDAGQARLDVEETRVALDKRSIRSPIDGVVTDVAARRGELISPGSPAVSVISAADYQISANLPEIDLAKVRPGLRAQVTLDPYGPEALFEAVVTSVSPAEVMVDGVPVYEVILQFVHDDERYRSGLTADVVVFGEVRKDTLAVPARAVIQKNGASYLRILENGQVTERRVRTGLRGSTGNIEILEGLSEGEEVLVYSQD
jgi:RND family efflux transporter MFP subunit